MVISSPLSFFAAFFVAFPSAGGPHPGAAGPSPGGAQEERVRDFLLPRPAAQRVPERQDTVGQVRGVLCGKGSSRYVVYFVLPLRVIVNYLFIYLFSYRENPALGDPNSLVEELLQIRNKVRMRESDLAMVKGKVRLYGDHNYSANSRILVQCIPACTIKSMRYVHI